MSILCSKGVKRAIFLHPKVTGSISQLKQDESLASQGHMLDLCSSDKRTFLRNKVKGYILDVVTG